MAGRVTVSEEGGVQRFLFEDVSGRACSIQHSSGAEENAIWFGARVAEPALQLSQELVAELLPVLRHFAETGELPARLPARPAYDDGLRDRPGGCIEVSDELG